ncbi:MAG: hypothetical protein LBQ13_01685 [Endomicrobium sp.]|nr:hypothetical protein [Endomicrobium sp.]
MRKEKEKIKIRGLFLKGLIFSIFQIKQNNPQASQKNITVRYYKSVVQQSLCNQPKTIKSLTLFSDILEPWVTNVQEMHPAFMI